MWTDFNLKGFVLVEVMFQSGRGHRKKGNLELCVGQIARGLELRWLTLLLGLGALDFALLNCVV